MDLTLVVNFCVYLFPVIFRLENTGRNSITDSYILHHIVWRWKERLFVLKRIRSACERRMFMWIYCLTHVAIRRFYKIINAINFQEETVCYWNIRLIKSVILQRSSLKRYPIFVLPRMVYRFFCSEFYKQ